MKIKLLTLGTPNLKWMYDLTNPSKIQYATKNGYEFVFCDTVDHPDRHPAWGKLGLVAKHLPTCDVVMWMDADALITNDTIRIESLIDQEHDLFICEGCQNPVNINTGVFVLRNTAWAREMVNRWRSSEVYSLFANTPCWEQTPLDAAYFMSEEFQKKTKLYKPRVMNSGVVRKMDPSNMWVPGDFIAHMPGLTDEQRLHWICQYLMSPKPSNLIK